VAAPGVEHPASPQWRSDLLWSASAFASGVLALIFAIATVINAQNLSSPSGVSTLDPTAWVPRSPLQQV
jgi:hypothetical protein